MTDWREVQSAARLKLDGVVSDLQTMHPNLWSLTEVRGNAVFPISLVATMNLTGPRREEDVVLAARVLVQDETFNFASDISKDDGQIIADGPESNLKLDGSPQVEWASACFDKFFVFIRANFDIIGAELNRINPEARAS